MTRLCAADVARSLCESDIERVPPLETLEGCGTPLAPECGPEPEPEPEPEQRSVQYAARPLRQPAPERQPELNSQALARLGAQPTLRSASTGSSATTSVETPDNEARAAEARCLLAREQAIMRLDTAAVRQFLIGPGGVSPSAPCFMGNPGQEESGSSCPSASELKELWRALVNFGASASDGRFYGGGGARRERPEMVRMLKTRYGLRTLGARCILVASLESLGT